MINLSREKLKELLQKTFDEGCCGYKDLKEDFIEQLLAETEKESSVAVVENKKDNYYSKLAWKADNVRWNQNNNQYLNQWTNYVPPNPYVTSGTFYVNAATSGSGSYFSSLGGAGGGGSINRVGNNQDLRAEAEAYVSMTSGVNLADEYRAVASDGAAGSNGRLYVNYVN